MKYYLINLLYLISFSCVCWEKQIIENGLKDGLGVNITGASVVVMTACALRNRIGQQPDDVCRIVRTILNKVDNQTINSQKTPSHYVFHGKRGTGKTSAVKAIAETTHSPNISVMTPTLVNGMDKKVSDQIDTIFNDALKQADEEGRSVIVFFDEIEAFASRCKSENCVEHQNTLKTLCSWLNKIKNDSRVVFIGATHEPRVLDQTFKNCIGENFVEFTLPDNKIREELIKFYLDNQGYSISSNDLYRLVKVSQGLSYRDIELTIDGAIEKSEAFGAHVEVSRIYETFDRKRKETEHFNRIPYQKKN